MAKGHAIDRDAGGQRLYSPTASLDFFSCFEFHLSPSMMTTPFSIKTARSPLERLLRTKKGHGSQIRPIHVHNQVVQRSMAAHMALISDFTTQECPTDLGFYDASNTLDDCAFAPTQSAPISALCSNAVAATPLPTDIATALRSALVIFFSNRILSCQRKKCANILTRIWGCHPSYVRTS